MRRQAIVFVYIIMCKPNLELCGVCGDSYVNNITICNKPGYEMSYIVAINSGTRIGNAFLITKSYTFVRMLSNGDSIETTTTMSIPIHIHRTGKCGIKYEVDTAHLNTDATDNVLAQVNETTGKINYVKTSM